jgi:hypothetical protein
MRMMKMMWMMWIIRVIRMMRVIKVLRPHLDHEGVLFEVQVPRGMLCGTGRVLCGVVWCCMVLYGAVWCCVLVCGEGVLVPVRVVGSENSVHCS